MHLRVMLYEHAASFQDRAERHRLEGRAVGDARRASMFLTIEPQRWASSATSCRSSQSDRLLLRRQVQPLQPLDGEFRERQDPLERIVDLVRNARREVAERGHLLDAEHAAVDPLEVGGLFAVPSPPACPDHSVISCRGTGEFFRHRIERLRQLSEFIGAVHGQPLVQVPRGHGLHAVDEEPHRPADEPPEECRPTRRQRRAPRRPRVRGTDCGSRRDWHPSSAMDIRTSRMPSTLCHCFVRMAISGQHDGSFRIGVTSVRMRSPSGRV